MILDRVPRKYNRATLYEVISCVFGGRHEPRCIPGVRCMSIITRIRRLTLSAQEPTLDVYGRQNLTSKVGPRTERFTYL